ncbi:uncharacterized protein LOC106946875 [Poecilia latipinna]|uniref:uncharacterized protein LOC106946875 n=1 Tax=Poecilia latipinna TaxID=48699 RepID=UPI00072E4F48|nr:PREDICTED: uncharacterized protein LOC106946875 [Poecilia latipinna]
MRTARLRIRRERRVLTAWILWQHVNALAARGGVRENPSATAGTPSCFCKPAARTRTSTASHERGQLPAARPAAAARGTAGGAAAGSYSPGRVALEVRRLPVPRSGGRGSVLVLLHLLPHFQTGPLTSGGSRLRLPDARGRSAPRGGSRWPSIRQYLPVFRARAPGGNPPAGPRRPRLSSEFRTDGFPGGSLLSGHVVALRRHRPGFPCTRPRSRDRTAGTGSGAAPGERRPLPVQNIQENPFPAVPRNTAMNLLSQTSSLLNQQSRSEQCIKHVRKSRRHLEKVCCSEGKCPR